MTGKDRPHYPKGIAVPKASSEAGSGETQPHGQVDRTESMTRAASADRRSGVKNLVGKAKDNNARR